MSTTATSSTTSRLSEYIYWIQIVPQSNNARNRRTKVTGPYTNSDSDRELLRKVLHKRCDDEQGDKDTIDQALDSRPNYYGLYDKDVYDAGGEHLFRIVVTKERNKAIADALREINGDATSDIYTVRERSLYKNTTTSDHVPEIVERCFRSGAIYFEVGNNLHTFRDKAEAIKHANDVLKSTSWEDDWPHPVREMSGLLVGLMCGGDATVKWAILVTKVRVSREVREDVYDLTE